MIHKLYTFIQSFILHILRGLPKSSISLIQQRYSICESCEFISKEKNQCLQCGCNISKEQIFMNKLAWHDQKCPLNKW